MLIISGQGKFGVTKARFLRNPGGRIADNLNQPGQSKLQLPVRYDLVPRLPAAHGNGFPRMIAHLLDADTIVMPAHMPAPPLGGPHHGSKGSGSPQYSGRPSGREWRTIGFPCPTGISDRPIYPPQTQRERQRRFPGRSRHEEPIRRKRACGCGVAGRNQRSSPAEPQSWRLPPRPALPSPTVRLVVCILPQLAREPIGHPLDLPPRKQCHSELEEFKVSIQQKTPGIVSPGL